MEFINIVAIESLTNSIYFLLNTFVLLDRFLQKCVDS